MDRQQAGWNNKRDQNTAIDSFKLAITFKWSQDVLQLVSPNDIPHVQGKITAKLGQYYPYKYFIEGQNVPH